jgi:hypothetical protein
MKSASQRILPIALLAYAHIFASAPAHALEGGQSHYLKGYRDFGTGILPPPGVQIRNDVYTYNGNENSRIPQGQLGIGIRTTMNVLGATFISPQPMLGGNYGFSIRASGAELSTNRTITTRLATNRRDGELTGLQDLVINPLILGWHAGNFHWNIVTAIWAPSGNYSTNSIANTGRNFWSWSPQIAATYFDPASGWEFTGSLSYLFNSENGATHYRSGDVLHVDLTVAKAIVPAVSVGVLAYVMEQVTPDSGIGATLGDRKAQVFGIGPGVQIRLAPGGVPTMLVIKYYREFSARNTTEGDAGSLSWRVKF